MAAIIVYGSLINPEQLDQKPHLFAHAHPVFVKGYRRVFNQEPSWRKGDNQHRAVLNVTKSDTDGFNGLLVRLQEGGDFHQLDERERGYDRIAMTRAQLVPFAPISSVGTSSIGTSSISQSEPTFIYVGKPEKRNDDLWPNKSYLDLCLRGAKHWGEDFHEQFLQTTYVQGLTLKTFL